MDRRSIVLIFFVGLILMLVLFKLNPFHHPPSTPPPSETIVMPDQDPTITKTPTKTKTPTEIASSDPNLPLLANTKQLSQCYDGPGEYYTIKVANIVVGTQVEVIGVNSYGENWFRVKGKTFVDICWVDINDLEYSFEIKSVHHIPTALAKEGSNCRYGSDPLYKNLVFVNEGQEVIVNSKNSVSGDWLLIENPPNYYGYCWVKSSLLDYHNIPILPISTSPPLPIELPTPTKKPGGNGDPNMPTPTPVDTPVPPTPTPWYCDLFPWLCD